MAKKSSLQWHVLWDTKRLIYMVFQAGTYKKGSKIHIKTFYSRGKAMQYAAYAKPLYKYSR